MDISMKSSFLLVELLGLHNLEQKPTTEPWNFQNHFVTGKVSNHHKSTSFPETFPCSKSQWLYCMVLKPCWLVINIVIWPLKKNHHKHHPHHSHEHYCGWKKSRTTLDGGSDWNLEFRTLSSGVNWSDFLLSPELRCPNYEPILWKTELWS